MRYHFHSDGAYVRTDRQTAVTRGHKSSESSIPNRNPLKNISELINDNSLCIERASQMTYFLSHGVVTKF